MRLIYTSIFILILPVLCAQENDDFKTIFGGKESGGYGSFSAGYTLIDSSDAFLVSARGGVILGHTFSMGLGGSGFFSEYRNDQVLNLKTSMMGGYGGVYFELIVLSNSPVHISIPVLAGIGGVAYTSWVNEGTDYDRVNVVEDMSSFLVIEPGIELELNVMQNFRLAGFFSMRYTTDIEITRSTSTGGSAPLVSPTAMNGFSAGLIFKFGKF